MARSPGGKPSSSGSRADGKSSVVRSALVLDGLAVVSVILALGVTMVLSLDARLWALESLGYGWVPAGLWLASVVFAMATNLRRIRLMCDVIVLSSSTACAASMSCCRFFTWPG